MTKGWGENKGGGFRSLPPPKILSPAPLKKLWVGGGMGFVGGESGAPPPFSVFVLPPR